jgi:O-antigen ligase
LYHDKAISRFSGGTGDPNNYGLYCLLLIYFYLPTLPRKKIAKTSFMIVGLMLAFGSLTVSRSFFLVAIMSLFLYFILYYRAAIGDVVFRMLAAFNGVLLLVAIYLLSGQSFDFNFAIFDRFGGDNLSELTGARSDIFQEYLRLFFELPFEFVLFGAGINGYLGYYNHSFAQAGIFSEVVGPHNTLLELLISFGLVGFMLFVAFIVMAFKAEQNRTKNKQVFRIALLSLVVFLLYCFSLQNLGKYGSYFILMMIVYNTYRRES